MKIEAVRTLLKSLGATEPEIDAILWPGQEIKIAILPPGGRYAIAVTWLARDASSDWALTKTEPR